MNNYMRLGHIGTHALEIFFGFLRLSCHYDHSCQNVFRTIGKTVLIKKFIENYNIHSPIRSRLGLGGTIAYDQKNGGLLPEFWFFDHMQ